MLVQACEQVGWVYPACAGIDRSHPDDILRPVGLPRMRGDRPGFGDGDMQRTKFTPHARGSTPYPINNRAGHDVYPACAGIDPLERGKLLTSSRLPRMRGDRPLMIHPPLPLMAFTPHARGSTFWRLSGPVPSRVYPACAGIDLVSLLANSSRGSLPRMRGDRPPVGMVYIFLCKFTPHARGSTWAKCQMSFAGCVYPACAGIDPT